MFGKDDLGRLSFGWGGIEEEGVGLYIYIYIYYIYIWEARLMKSLQAEQDRKSARSQL